MTRAMNMKVKSDVNELSENGRSRINKRKKNRKEKKVEKELYHKSS